MRQVCLHSGTVFLSVSVHGAVLGWLRSKEHLRLLICSGGCWFVDFDTVLAADPYTNFKPFLIYMKCSLFVFFCNLVSDPYAGSLSCARKKCLFC